MSTSPQPTAGAVKPLPVQGVKRDRAQTMVTFGFCATVLGAILVFMSQKFGLSGDALSWAYMCFGSGFLTALAGLHAQAVRE